MIDMLTVHVNHMCVCMQVCSHVFVGLWLSYCNPNEWQLAWQMS